MSEMITLSHGSGGRQTLELIQKVFARRFGMNEPLTDSAVLGTNAHKLAFTTDSFVVDPVFFPGGNIGKLAICGTVNDLAVSGADPQYIAASFIIEEGFSLDDLDLIASSMAEEAENAGVKIVTGDTKVVEKDKCDKLFICTTGIGFIRPGFEHISTGGNIMPGDKLIINGSVGSHSIAVLGARNSLTFSSPVISDCASLNGLIRKALDGGGEIRFMRDLTRGGLAAAVNELAGMTRHGMVINESDLPVDEPVKGLCEMMGFDPLYLANEGKVLFVVKDGDHKKILEALRSDNLGKNSAVIGEISEDRGGRVILNTISGGRRIVELPSGLQLPRIC